MEDVTVFKLVSIAAIWLVGLIGGLVPALLASKKQHSTRTKYVLSVLNAFSGGVFLAGGFFHLLHSAVENPALQKWSTIDDGRYEFPYAEMFCTLGFLGLLLLEQGAHAQMGSHEASSKAAAYVPARHDDDLDEEYGSRGDASDTYVEEEDEEDDEENALRGFATSSKVRSPSSHHHSGHSHGHSHLGPAPAGSSLAVAIVLFIALSFHSVLEGLGIGAQTSSAWGVFLAIVVHKGLAAFALGSGLVQSSLKTSHVILYMVVFSFMSIIGIIIGWIIAADSSEDSAAAGICVALASGTFIYVAVMEVIPQEFPRHSGGSHKPQHTTQKMIALCLGYAIFGVLAKWS
uniref:Zinc/iron permease n=1 Tax=Globisporangium ultimum (strain ATCC 200006 / CBS 805.95 / DAOM BR144) TaxID=431595 RepID=K3WWH9_GLOUD